MTSFSEAYAWCTGCETRTNVESSTVKMDLDLPETEVQYCPLCGSELLTGDEADRAELEAGQTA